MTPKSERTREQLIRAMARLLQAQGYAATGLAQILAASGVPKGSLYYHFPGGKEELAAAAIGAAGQSIARNLGRICDAEPNPVAMVAAGVAFYIGQLEQSGYTAGCHLATITLEAAATSDRIRAACAQAFGAMGEPYTAALVASGMPPAAAADLTTMIIATIEGGLILSRAQGSTAPLRSTAALLQAAVAAALAQARPAKEQTDVG